MPLGTKHTDGATQQGRGEGRPLAPRGLTLGQNFCPNLRGRCPYFGGVIMKDAIVIILTYQAPFICFLGVVSFLVYVLERLP